MTFFWFIEPWRALLGKQRNNAKTTSQPVKLTRAFYEWGKAKTPPQRQALGRVRGALLEAGYETLQDLDVPDEQLLNVQGIGPAGLRLIRQIGGRYAED